MTPSEREEDKIRGDTIAEWLAQVASLAFFAGILVVAGQGIFWLKTGDWPPLPISFALQWIGVDAHPIFATSWNGLNQILWWFLDQHVFFGLLLIGGVAGWLLGEVAYAYSRFQRRSAA